MANKVDVQQQQNHQFGEVTVMNISAKFQLYPHIASEGLISEYVSQISFLIGMTTNQTERFDKSGSFNTHF